jgi:carboxylesterase type B
MGGYWRTFAAQGDPNFAGAPDWPTYDPSQDSALQSDVQTSPIDRVRAPQCDFWDALGL